MQCAARHFVLYCSEALSLFAKQPVHQVEAINGFASQVQTTEKRGSGVVYTRPEDQFYHQHSSWSFLFPTNNRPIRKDELQPLRIVMWLKSAAARAAR